jgi:membrane-bound inhibitor of C-type lysozyme
MTARQSRSGFVLVAVLVAVQVAGFGCGTSSMMRAEQGVSSGRAAARASRAVTETEQLRLQALAVQAASAQVGAVRGEAITQSDLPAARAVAAPNDDGATLYLECGDEGPSFVVRVEGQEARLYLPDGEVRLTRVPSADGARYTDGKTVLWSKGDAAIFENEQGMRYMCSNNPQLAAWQDARRRGVALRGVGEGWILEMAPSKTLLLTGDGANRFDMATPEPTLDERRTVYEGRDQTIALRITTEPKACIDPATGEKFDVAVQVDVGATTLHGCGRDLTEAP